MKATGIVRRIDDLGRVVIPKEIRRTMRIREGDRYRRHWYRGKSFVLVCWIWPNGRLVIVHSDGISRPNDKYLRGVKVVTDNVVHVRSQVQGPFSQAKSFAKDI